VHPAGVQRDDQWHTFVVPGLGIRCVSDEPWVTGAETAELALALLETRWHEFVVDGLGIHCVDTNPWVTGAETCELAMALDALGDQRRALKLLAEMQHLRAEEGKYWTGWVYGDDVH